MKNQVAFLALTIPILGSGSQSTGSIRRVSKDDKVIAPVVAPFDEMMEQFDPEAEVQVEDPDLHVDDDIAGREAPVPKKLEQPKQPTRLERERHNLCHVPFASWCDLCVQGRGKDTQHKSG